MIRKILEIPNAEFSAGAQGHEHVALRDDVPSELKAYGAVVADCVDQAAVKAVAYENRVLLRKREVAVVVAPAKAQNGAWSL